MQTAFPNFVDLIEVGPREGFQFEGAEDPGRIAIEDKVLLIRSLMKTGLRTIQVASFVSPKIVPQMADAEQICARLQPQPGVHLTGIYLNDSGLRRALATGILEIRPEIVLSASEGFTIRNQRRTREQDYEVQRSMASTYAAHGLEVSIGNVTAAFGCNFDGEITVSRVVETIEQLEAIASEAGGALSLVNLADTMGWANPELVRRVIGTIRGRWPHMRLGLHLHNTRGLAIANVYAGLCEGVDRFDTGVGGLGGCPFTGNRGTTGNVATEEVVFLCEELGIKTGVDLPLLVEAARLAEEIVRHPLPSHLLSVRLPRTA